MNDISFIICYFGIGFLSHFATGVIGFTVVAAANMLTAMRVFDGITGLIIGVMMDKCNSRFGKFRLFVAGGNLIMAISMLLMYYTVSKDNSTISLRPRPG